jgi:hypothetical protein
MSTITYKSSTTSYMFQRTTTTYQLPQQENIAQLSLLAGIPHNLAPLHKEIKSNLTIILCEILRSCIQKCMAYSKIDYFYNNKRKLYLTSYTTACLSHILWTLVHSFK